MSQKQSKYVWSFNKFLPQFGKALSAEEYLLKNDSKYTIVQYYQFLEHQYSEPLKQIIETVYDDLNVPIDVVNIITVYNSGGIIYDYTKSFEQYTKGNVIYITPIILGYIETFLFISLFITMFLMHFQFKYDIFESNTAYSKINQCLLIISILYSLMLFIHTVCVIISYHQCRNYEIIIRNFKRSLYSNKNFSNHVRMINMKELCPEDDEDDEEEAGGDDTATPDNNTSVGHSEDRHLNTNNNKYQTHIEMFDLDLSDNEDNDGVPEYHIDDDDNLTMESSISDDIMDRWQYTTTYKEAQQEEFLSILNPSNNSFAYVAYQRWLNVKKLELDNDAFTRSKSALVLNLSKYWLTSYFTLIIILIFVIPNSVYLYFAFVLTLFLMYYCYLRTIKNLDHSAALKKVLYLFCSFVIGTIITLIIIFTTEDPSTSASTSTAPSSGGNGGDGSLSIDHGGSSGSGTGGNNGGGDGSSISQTTNDLNTSDNGVTFWIFDVIFPILEGIFALLYTWITASLCYKICKYNVQGYHLWLCCVNAFGFWLLTFWIPSWKITEISILCTLLLLVSCYLYLQQISHRIMTGLNKQEYINKHCAPNPKQWLKTEIKQLFVPYTFWKDDDNKE